MKQVLAILLLALIAVVAYTSAQEQQQQADLTLRTTYRCMALTPECGYYLSEDELADKKWWKPVLNIVGQIGKGAIKDYVNKNWDELAEEESDFNFGELFKAVLPYLKAGAKEYLNNVLQSTQSDSESQINWKGILDIALPYIKAGVKEYVNNNWDNMTEADKGFWGKVWNVVKQVGAGVIKNYVNTNWDEQQTEESDKFWKKLLKVVGQVGKGALKAYVNNNFDEESDKFFKKLGKLLKKTLPYLKAGVKEYINNNFDEEADFKFGKLLKKVGKIGLKLGKAYLRTQGLPLEDNEVAVPRRAIRRRRTIRRIRAPRFERAVIRRRRANVEESDAEFFKKLGKLFKKALPYLKAGVKEYVNNNFDEVARG
ncbi:hypothetical protein ABK040_011276 [Willaertia magna]